MGRCPEARRGARTSRRPRRQSARRRPSGHLGIAPPAARLFRPGTPAAPGIPLGRTPSSAPGRRLARALAGPALRPADARAGPARCARMVPARTVERAVTGTNRPDDMCARARTVGSSSAPVRPTGVALRLSGRARSNGPSGGRARAASRSARPRLRAASAPIHGCGRKQRRARSARVPHPPAGRALCAMPGAVVRSPPPAARVPHPRAAPPAPPAAPSVCPAPSAPSIRSACPGAAVAETLSCGTFDGRAAACRTGRAAVPSTSIDAPVRPP